MNRVDDTGKHKETKRTEFMVSARSRHNKTILGEEGFACKMVMENTWCGS
jgi:hypothetical protein